MVLYMKERAVFKKGSEESNGLKELRALFAELESVAREQLALLKGPEEIAAGDKIPELLELIEQRQRLMDQIDALNTRFKDKAWNFELEGLKGSISRALDHDKEAVQAARGFLQGLGTRLGQARKEIKALKHYAGLDEPVMAHFYDRRR